MSSRCSGLERDESRPLRLSPSPSVLKPAVCPSLPASVRAQTVLTYRLPLRAFSPYIRAVQPLVLRQSTLGSRDPGVCPTFCLLISVVKADMVCPSQRSVHAVFNRLALLWALESPCDSDARSMCWIPSHVFMLTGVESCPNDASHKRRHFSAISRHFFLHKLAPTLLKAASGIRKMRGQLETSCALPEIYSYT